MMVYSDHIIDVNEIDFDYEVVKYSENKLVVVDFWADWSKPCKVLSPLLEKLVQEAAGSFRLARVDLDKNPNLAARYGVRSIPNLKAFSGGVIAAELTGVQPETRLREWLGKINPPSPMQLDLEKADSWLQEGQTGSAEKIYLSILEKTPQDAGAIFGLAKCKIRVNRPEEALALLRVFPASRFFNSAMQMISLAQTMDEFNRKSLPGETDLDAAFENSIRLITRGNFPAALDGLLELLKQNRRYRGDRARQVYLGVLELLGPEDSLSRQYRSELAGVLF